MFCGYCCDVASMTPVLMPLRDGLAAAVDGHDQDVVGSLPAALSAVAAPKPDGSLIE